MVSARERNLLHRLYTQGAASRLELAREMSLTPNATGEIVSRLITRGILRECDPAVKGRGRPSIPVELDTAHRHVLGIALQRGAVQVARLNLRGQPVEPATHTEVQQAARLVRTAVRLISRSRSDATFAAGFSVTGFVDVEQRRLLLSSAIAGMPDADLNPIYEALADVPLYVQNDMHALAGRWLLTQQQDTREDTLLVLLADGQVGSTLLVRGRHNDGCVVGGNELGHMRLPVTTDRCYCGQTGCIERIFSSEYARARLGLIGSLDDMLRRYDGRRSPLAELISLTATSLANAVNFVRPHRLVLTSAYARYSLFTNELLRRTREALLPALADRVRIDLWEQPAASPAETAGYLPLAAMYLDAWA